MVVNSGSSLIVYPEALININGSLSVKGSGKFLLKNTADKKSALFLNGDATGTIQSEYQVIKGKKNLVSSPVEMAYSKTFLNMYLRTYDETTGQWGSYIAVSYTHLDVYKRQPSMHPNRSIVFLCNFAIKLRAGTLSPVLIS